MRRTFTPQQKLAAVLHAESVGLRQAAKDMATTHTQIAYWRKALGKPPQERRARFTPEQREAALARAKIIGIAQAAAELGIKDKTLYSWNTAANQRKREQTRREQASAASMPPAEATLAAHWPGKCLRIITAPASTGQARDYLHPRNVALPRGCTIAQRFRIHAGSEPRLAYMDGETVAQAASLQLHPEVLDALAATIATGKQEAAAHLLAAAQQQETAAAVVAMRALHSEGFFRSAHHHSDRLALAALVARDLLAQTKVHPQEEN